MWYEKPLLKEIYYCAVLRDEHLMTFVQLSLQGQT